MFQRQNVRERIETAKREQTEAHPYVSKSYTRFFEGYEEVLVPKKNGTGERIKRIYRGDYYKQDISDRRWVVNKVLYGTAFLLSAAGFLFAAVPGYAVNRAVYVTIPQAVCVAGYLWLFTMLSSYIVSPREMTVSKWKRACKMITTACKILAGALAVVLAGNLMFLAINGGEGVSYMLSGMAAYLLSAGLIIAICLTEQHVTYLTVQTDAE